MRPDPTPTDARLFPLEPNATADLDATVLDDLAALLKQSEAMTDDGFRAFTQLARGLIRSTGREV